MEVTGRRPGASPDSTRLTVCTPVVLEHAVAVVLQDPVQARIQHPDRPVLVEPDVDGIEDVRPFLDELPAVGEELNAIVLPIADVDAVFIHGETVEEIELARAVPERAPLHHMLAVLRVFDDA